MATLSEGSLAKDGSDETARQWQRDPNSRALLRPRDGAVAFVHASRTIQVETSDKRGRSIGTFSQCSVAALSDLGLTDAEISQYFGVEVHRVRRLLDGHDGPMENRSLREFALRVRARLLGKAK